MVSCSKLFFVDLAGSERTPKGKSDGESEQASSVSKGLLALDKVVRARAEGSSKATYIPYRDSLLTRVTQVNQAG